MHPQKLEKLIRDFKAIVEKSRPPVQGQAGYSPACVYSMDNKLEIEYAHFIRTILKSDGLEKKISEQFIKDRLSNIISNHLKSEITSKIGEAFSSFINEMENYNTSQIVIIPFAGIKLKMSEFLVGPVKLKLMDAAAIETVKAHHEKIVRQLSNTKDEQDSIIQEFSENMNSLLGKVCAEFTEVAEPTRAIELAKQQCKWVLAALRYAIPFLYVEYQNVRIGFDGTNDVSRTFSQIIVYANESIRVNTGVHGTHFSLEISESNLKKLEKSGFNELCVLLNKDSNNLSDFETKVLDALYWYGKGQHEFVIEDRLLHCMTAMETLFTSQGSGVPVSMSVAESASIILTSDIKQRQQNKKIILRLYKERSNLSHGFTKTVLDQDAFTLMIVSLYMIQFAVLNISKFRTAKELQTWLEYIRLSGPAIEPIDLDSILREDQG